MSTIRIAWRNLQVVETDRQNKGMIELYSSRIHEGEILAVLGEEAQRVLPVFNNQMPYNGTLYMPKYVQVLNGGEETVYLHLTVEEHVSFYLRLCQLSSEEIKERTNSILDCYDLSVCRYEKVAKHSYGPESDSRLQRIMAASLLALHPKLVILDDPFRFLAPDDAHHLLRSHKQYARMTGAAIIVYLSEPNDYLLELIDRVMLFVQGPRLAYFGALASLEPYLTPPGIARTGMSTQQILRYFQADYSSADGFMLSIQRANALAQRWSELQADSHEQEPLDPIHQDEDPIQLDSYVRRLRILSWCFMVTLLRDHLGFLAVVIQSTFAFLLTCFIYFRKPLNFTGMSLRSSLFYSLAINNTFAVSIPATIFYHTHLNGFRNEIRKLKLYPAWLLVIAKLIVIWPLRLSLVLAIMIPLYFLTDLRIDSFARLLVFLGLISLNTLVSATVGVLIGALAPSLEATQLLMVLAIDVFILFGGLGQRLERPSWVIRWLQYISPIFYTFRGLLRNELEGQRGVDVEGFLRIVEIDGLTVGWAAGALGILCAGYLLLALLASFIF